MCDKMWLHPLVTCRRPHDVTATDGIVVTRSIVALRSAPQCWQAGSVTHQDSNQTGPSNSFWGWPPTPKMQIMFIVGVCVLINIVLLGIWVLALYLR